MKTKLKLFSWNNFKLEHYPPTCGLAMRDGGDFKRR